MSGFPSTPTPTLVQKLWFELDRYIAMGFEYPDRDPEQQPDETQWLLDKQRKIGAGRGIAVALRIMLEPFFDTDDEVLAIATGRYFAAKNGKDLPATPGFEGTALMPSVVAHVRR